MLHTIAFFVLAVSIIVFFAASWVAMTFTPVAAVLLLPALIGVLTGAFMDAHAFRKDN